MLLMKNTYFGITGTGRLNCNLKKLNYEKRTEIAEKIHAVECRHCLLCWT